MRRTLPKLTFAIYLLTLTASSVLAQSVFIESPVIPHFVDGPLTRSLVIVTNNDPGYSATYDFKLYAEDGTPLKINFDATGVTSELSGSLTPGQSAFFHSTGNVAVQGWGILDDLHTSSSVSVAQVIEIADPNTGRFNSEATVPGSTNFWTTITAFPFDNTNGNISSMAMVDTSAYSNDAIKVTVKDEGGHVILTDTITLKSLQHIAFVLTDRWPGLNNVRGTVLFAPSANSYSFTSMMALRFAALSAGFTMTTLPPVVQ